MKAYFFPLILLTFFISCEKNEQIDEELDHSKINLSDISIGQKTFYKGFLAECEKVSSFNYSGDTLVLEIVQKDGDTYLMEYFTDGSPSKKSSTNSYSKINSIKNGLKIQEREQSKFFNFYGSDTLQLNAKDFINMKQENCIVKMDDQIFRGGEMGRIDQFNIGDIKIANKVIVSCIPIVEVNGYILYDNNQLFLNYTHYASSFNGITTNTITGWVKI